MGFLECSLNQEAVWQITAHTKTAPVFERTSKRRKGFPSETQVKKGLRIVHGDKELREKLGRNDACPCGSMRKFKNCCMRSGCFRRLSRHYFFPRVKRVGSIPIHIETSRSELPNSGPMPAKKLTKSALLQVIAQETDTDRKTAAFFLEVITGIALREVKKNGEFTLPGIGKLVKQKRKARIGRNPKTGEKIKIAAKTVVKFRVAKAAKDSLLGAK
jgi:DNA-binding protein HU-beta